MDLIAHEQLAGFNEKLEDHKMHLKTFMATRFYETIDRMAKEKEWKAFLNQTLKDNIHHRLQFQPIDMPKGFAITAGPEKDQITE